LRFSWSLGTVLNGIQYSIDLVVLSGCQTASGYVMKGEGLSSLTRSFTELGALSIVSTLWPVNDKVTTSIIEFFYDRLVQGKMKDIALSQAKLQYIETVKDLESAHPYY